MDAFQLLLLVSSICSTTRQTDGASILFFIPYPIQSHHNIATPLAKALVHRGHNVTYTTPFTNSNLPPNVNIVKIKNILPDLQGMFNVEQQSSGWLWKTMTGLFTIVGQMEERIYDQEAFKSLLESDNKFDAVIDCSSTLMETSAALDHRFGSIGIELLNTGTSHWTNHLLGNPNNPSYMLDFKSPFTDTMTYWERFQNTFVYLLSTFVYGQFIMPSVQSRADKYIRYPGWETRPPLEDIIANKSLVLVNSHPSMSYAAPSAPHFVDIGGITIVPNKPLPKELKNYLDNATEGFVYFSLGGILKVSNILSGELLIAFREALGSLKANVLWKWEKDNFPEKPINVITSHWFPQPEVLAHPNCRAFITHGGMVSLTEALYYAVPVVGIPVFGDQRKNTIHAESQGYGIRLEIANLTKNSIAWALDEVLYNPSEAAKRKSKVFKDRPMSALDTAVYWVEYVIRHKGAPHLKPRLAKLKWYESMLLDVVALIAVLLSALVFGLYFITINLLRLITGALRKMYHLRPNMKMD